VKAKEVGGAQPRPAAPPWLWQVGQRRTRRQAFGKHGRGVFPALRPATYTAHTYFPRYLVRNSLEVPLAGNTGNPAEGQSFSQYAIFDESKRFIRENKDRPFFAYLCWTPPHGQWGIPKDDPSWLLYKDKPWKSGNQKDDDAKIYAAMVNLVDRQLGEIRRY
jgi:hypothetical protein